MCSPPPSQHCQYPPDRALRAVAAGVALGVHQLPQVVWRGNGEESLERRSAGRRAGRGRQADARRASRQGRSGRQLSWLCCSTATAAPDRWCAASTGESFGTTAVPTSSCRRPPPGVRSVGDRHRPRGREWGRPLPAPSGLMVAATQNAASSYNTGSACAPALQGRAIRGLSALGG